MYFRDGTTDIARNFVYGIPTERHKVFDGFKQTCIFHVKRTPTLPPTLLNYKHWGGDKKKHNTDNIMTSCVW